MAVPEPMIGAYPNRTLNMHRDSRGLEHALAGETDEGCGAGGRQFENARLGPEFGPCIGMDFGLEFRSDFGLDFALCIGIIRLHRCVR